MKSLLELLRFKGKMFPELQFQFWFNEIVRTALKMYNQCRSLEKGLLQKLKFARRQTQLGMTFPSFSYRFDP